MKKIISKLSKILTKKQKKQMAGLVVLMLIGGALETASIALVLSVVAVITSPDQINNNKYVHAIFEGLGFTDYRVFAVVVMLLLILIFILKNVYLFWQWKLQYAFVYRNQFSTSEKMFRSYLKRGYEYFLYADTAVVQRSITSDVNNMYGLVLALLTLISEMIVAVSLVTISLIIEPLMCIIIGSVLVVTMFFITKILKPVMQRSGQENQDFYAGLFKHISQTIQGIKEVKISGKEQHFIESYKTCGRGYVNAVERYSLYNNTPKLLIETVCISGMILYMILLVARGDDIATKVPVFAAFAAVAVKLMPSANKINNQLNAIAYFEPFLMNVSATLIDDISDSNTDMSFVYDKVEKLELRKEISLEKITYKYPKTERYIFKDADMKVPIGAAVGVVGSSGAGKTTVVDILLGLLALESGDIYADGVNIRDNYRGWLKNVGYIPQMIYMLDSNIRENVAFGVDRDEIDEDRVWEVLKEAHLDEYVRNLPDGLDTEIGERGIRLSGGQRQRIGIARALYNDPELLILDEATSALDNDTEKAIMESINMLHGKKTLIIIAHRLQTIEKCDIVYRVSEGNIIQER